MKTTKEYLLTLFLFGGVAVFFLRGVLARPGIIIGSDWSLPLTPIQMQVFGRQALYTWIQSYQLLGARLAHLNTYPFNLLFLIFSHLDISGAMVGKILLFSLFVAVSFSAYYFSRKTNLSFKASLLAGFVYLATPLVFNYSIMGWIFLLWLMALLPFFLLLFKLSLEREQIKYSIFAGFLFALALFQAQAVFWFPLLMISFLPFFVSTRRGFLVFLRSFLLVVLIALLFHANWILPFVFAPDRGIIRAVSAYDIGRFEAKLNFKNMIRLWGGLFNFQFETVYPKILLSVSFVLPALSFLALILKKRDKKVLHLASVALLPLIIYSLRNILYRVPFSTVIRDFGRMMILSALPYSVLAAISFEEAGKIKERVVAKVLSAVIILLLFLNSLPFWTGELYGESRIDHDQRLRTLDFPKEYQEAEEFLLKDATDTKTLYLPGGLLLGFLDNKKFYGPYKEAVDIFALLSYKPGAFAFSDKTSGPSVDYGKLILNAVKHNKKAELESLLAFTSIDEFVIRKNTYGAGGEGGKIEKTAESLSGVSKIFDKPKISIFKNNNFLPHFYIPENIIYSNNDVESLPNIVSFGDYQARSAVFMGDTEYSILNTDVDEIFVEAEKKMPILPPLRPKLKKEWVFPQARISPTSPLYFLVQIKEVWARRKAESSLDKADIFLWHATKRLVEAKNLTSSNHILEVETSLDQYLDYASRAVSILRKMEEKDEKFAEKVEKTLGYFLKNEEILEELKPIVGEERVEKAKNLHSQFKNWVGDLQEEYKRRYYKLEIPREGEYELFVEKEILDWIKDKDSIKVSLEEKRLAPSKKQEDSWIFFGKEYFNKGEYDFYLTLPEHPNLISDESWQEVKPIKIKRGEVSLKICESDVHFPEPLLFQEIKNWGKDYLYRISFDYKTEGGKLELAILEDKKEVMKVELKSEGEWESFEKVIKPSGDSQRAEIYLYFKAESSEKPFGQGDFKEMKVIPLVQPDIVLRMKVGERVGGTAVPKIKFIKINPTKYHLKVEEVKEPYTLIFLESFHKDWKIYVAEDGKLWGKKPIAENGHFLINGYANSWYIEPSDVGGKENYDLIVEFWPQQLSYVGLFISGVTLIGCVGYLLISLVSKKEK